MKFCVFGIFLFQWQRRRIYLRQDELAEVGLSDKDIFKGVITDKWRKFMKRQIKRARIDVLRGGGARGD